MVVNASRDDRIGGGRADERIAQRPRAALWHDLECGSYAADLPLWRELAAPAGTGARSQSILDVGAGTGRVSLDLARRGHRMTALDLDPELLDTLRARAAELPVETVCADARAFELPRRDFAVCLAPMQTVQLLGGATGRLAFLRRARSHLRAGGLLACAIVTQLEPFDCAAGDRGPSPELVSVDGTRYVSRATRVHVGRRSILIERERSVLPSEQLAASAPATPERDVVELDRLSVSQLEREARDAGLSAAGARMVAATEEHTGSVVVMLRA